MGVVGSYRVASRSSYAQRNSDFFTCAALGDGLLVLSDWRRVPQRQSLRPVESSDLVQLLDQAEDPIHLSVSQSVKVMDLFGLCWQV